jgi:hypothetical protein
MSPIVVCVYRHQRGAGTRRNIFFLYFSFLLAQLTDDLKVKLFDQKESQHGRQFFKKGPIKTKCYLKKKIKKKYFFFLLFELINSNGTQKIVSLKM